MLAFTPKMALFELMLLIPFAQNQKHIEVPNPAPVEVVSTQLETIKKLDVSYS